MKLTNNEIKKILEDLDHKCWSCDGGTKVTPSILADNEKILGVCGVCDGVGYFLTDAGESLISFLNRHKKKLL